MSEALNLPGEESRRTYMPDDATFERDLNRRQQTANRWAWVYSLSTVIAVIVLIVLLGTLINRSFGVVISDTRIPPETLIPEGSAATTLEELTSEELIAVTAENISRGRMIALLRDEVLAVSNTEGFTDATVSSLFDEGAYPEDLAETSIRDLTAEQTAALIHSVQGDEYLLDLIIAEVVGYQLLETYNLDTLLFNNGLINAELETYRTGDPENNIAAYPTARRENKAWISLDFIQGPISSSAAVTGIQTALVGTVWVLAITVLVALPLGVGAAIYLEEYSEGGWVERLIETNIRNLAGVPSIVYGMLGLLLFVRVLSDFTGGRSILSGALTMSMLVLPVIIANAQEAIRAVPSSLREASYGMGATRWQTVSRTVLPSALPGIMTGLILSVSRAIGETAPLLFLAVSSISGNPSSPLDRFTVLPIQIFAWTQLPQAEWRNVAGAAIIVLLVVLLSLNATAILIRQRFSRRLI
jgi:phosphate transport system permease protein